AADAMLTRQPLLALGILTADCTPILLAARAAGVVGAAHAGWRGAVEGVVGAPVGPLVARGGGAANIGASVGPALVRAPGEVGAPFMNDLVRLRPGGWRHFWTRNGGRAHFGLPGFVEAELRVAGGETLERVGGCTYGHPASYFSHRHATHQGGKTGRQIAIIG